MAAFEVNVKEITPPIKRVFRVEIFMRPEDFREMTEMLKSLMQSNTTVKNYGLLENLYCTFANTKLPGDS